MKIIVFTVVCLLTLLGLAWPGETLKVTGHSDRAPFDWREGETIQGAAVEIIATIFQELHVEVESLHVGPWARALLSLADGSIDVLCGVYATPERRKFAEFTIPFRQDRVSVFVWHERSFPFRTFDDLAGKTIGDVIGASRGREFDEWRKAHAQTEFVSDNLVNLKKLEKGRIDCFVMSHDSGLIFIKKHGYEGRIVPLEKAVEANDLCYGISKKSKYIEYLPQINRKLVEMQADGTIEKIIKKNIDRVSSNPAFSQGQ